MMKKSEFIKRCKDFFAKWIYRKDDYDRAYENQCVDTAKRFFDEVCGISPAPATGTGWADGYWYNRTKIPAIYKNFEFIIDKAQLETGDIVITSNPHVAIYNEGKLFGQNHGGHLEANDNVPFGTFSRHFLGALRFKYDTDGIYKVRVTCDLPLNVRSKAGVNYEKVMQVNKGDVYTITETVVNDYTWGRLKSGAGWIALEYTERI